VGYTPEVLAIRNLSFAHGARKLLNDASLTIDDGQRVSLLGKNGAGKSTLLVILAGELGTDDGLVERGRGQTVGILTQTPRIDEDARVIDVALAALHAITHQDAIDAGESEEHRIDEVLSRLSVTQRTEPVRALSGGGRRRLDVARLLLQRPDVLLLDEPTNHLDVEGMRFLADELRAHRGVVLFVSHDRAFVDDVATRIVELEDGKLIAYPAPADNQTSPTDAYLEAKLLRDEHAARSAHRQRRLYVRELAWLRAGTPARTTKQAARIQRAEALSQEVEAETKRLREHKARVQIEGAKARRLGKSILELKGLVLARGERILVAGPDGPGARTSMGGSDGLDLALVPGDRWGIVGENGAGKTTLLSAVLTAAGATPAGAHSAVQPLRGHIVVGKQTKIAVYDQHRANLDPEATLEEILAGQGDHVHVGERRTHIAGYLEQFLFEGSDRYRKVKTLSGGQQNRLVFARLFQQDANLLLLDEPTNDLDVETLGVLEDALAEHAGVALIVSHDRRFLDRVATGILAFEGGGRVVPVPGDWTNYTRLRAQAAPATAMAASLETEASKRVKGGKRKRSYKEQQEFSASERIIQEAEAKRDALQATLDAGEIFRSDPAKGAQMAKDVAELGVRIEKMYARWQELSELASM
jgi:ATP-binding cassette subfamily F protein uup